MQQFTESPQAAWRRAMLSRSRRTASWLAVICLATLLALTAFIQTAQSQEGEEIPFSAASLIIETNATDCDVGIQVFFDGDPWKNVTIENPNGRRVFNIRLGGDWRGWGLTEHFNESSEPPIEELVAAFPELECEEPESSLEEFFETFPAGAYEFEGTTVEGDALDGEAVFSHVIPASPVIVTPMEGILQDPDNTVISWIAVTDPILPDLGPVDIVGYRVNVQPGMESPQNLEIRLPAGTTSVSIPPEILEAGTEYKFDILAIDASGNQTIVESGFETTP